jgi:hypothetical protein
MCSVAAWRQSDVLLVVIGAGASFDSMPRDVNTDNTVSAAGLGHHTYGIVRPPLTKDLAREQTFYNHLVSKYPESGPLMDFLRRALVATRDGQPALTLEHALAQYQARSKSDKSILRQMMAIRFYPAPTTFSTAETTTTLPLWMLPPPPTTAETEPETTQPSIPFPAETAPPELPLPMPPEPTVPPDTSVTCNPNGNGGFTCDQGP